MRVVFSPTCCTVPAIDSKTMKSPISNGLSSPIASDANRSLRMLCTASATATPPTPRLATKVVTLIPTLARIASSSTDHSTKRSTHAIIDVMTGLRVAWSCAASFSRVHSLTPRLSHSAIWNPMMTNQM